MRPRRGKRVIKRYKDMKMKTRMHIKESEDVNTDERVMIQDRERKKNMTTKM